MFSQTWRKFMDNENDIKTEEVSIEEDKAKGRSPKSFLLDTVKGATLGISAAVAGLSAGTIAVAEKCYDTLVGSISDLRKNFKTNFLILLPYIIGLLIGAVCALIGIQRAYNVAPFSLTGLFAGFIIGSLPVTFIELKKGNSLKENAFHISSFAICLIIAAGLGIVTALTNFKLNIFDGDSVIWYMYILILIAGFIGAFACVIPGISGSMTLMVIGVYYPFLNCYTGADSIWHSGSSTKIILGLILLVIFAIGVILGVFASSKTMNVLLSKHRVTTFYGILGLILGSLVSMFINSSIFPYYSGFEENGVFHQIQTWDYIVGSILFVVAAVFMIFFIRHVNKSSEEKTK